MLSLRLPISKNEGTPLFISLYDEIFLNISDTPLIKIDCLQLWDTKLTSK